MAAHEHDEIAEYHVVGEGTYSNLRVAEVFEDDEVVAITPVKMPKAMLVGTNLVFLLFGAGFYLAIHLMAPDQRMLALLAVAGIMVLTCGLFTAFTVYSVRKANRLGPWLIYEKATGRVILPRQDKQFGVEQIVCLQLITSKYFNFRDSEGGVSELNLITDIDGEQKRWVLLRDNATTKPLQYIADPLMALTDMPVMRYRKRRNRPVEIDDMRTADLGRDFYLY